MKYAHVVKRIKKLIRFSTIGAISGLSYAAVTAVFINKTHVDASVASAVGYALAIPVSFIGHRKFTFRSTDRAKYEFVRFCIVHGMNMALSYYLMKMAVEILKLPYWYGISMCILTVPITTFLIMNKLVFKNQNA
jgi:putative flippase GtrA